MRRSARVLRLALASIGLALLAPGCSPATPRLLSDAELMKRFEAHRAEFEQLRTLGFGLATEKAKLWAQGKIQPGPVAHAIDSLDAAWLADPRVRRWKAALDLHAIHVSADSGMYYAIRAPGQKAGPDSLGAGGIANEKGIGWSPHPSRDSWNEAADLDTLRPPRNRSMGSATFHRLLGGGWFLFRVIETARTP